MDFKWNLTEICSLGSNWQYGSIGSDNGLAPNRRLAIMLTNVDLLYWCIYASLGLSESRHLRFHNLTLIPMAWFRTGIPPLLMHWRCMSNVQSHWYVIWVSTRLTHKVLLLNDNLCHIGSDEGCSIDRCKHLWKHWRVFRWQAWRSLNLTGFEISSDSTDIMMSSSLRHCGDSCQCNFVRLCASNSVYCSQGLSFHMMN